MSASMARKTTSAVTVTAASRQVQNPMRLNGTINVVLLPVKREPHLVGQQCIHRNRQQKPSGPYDRDPECKLNSLCQNGHASPRLK